MVREDKTTWKSNYFMHLIELLDEYPKLFVVGVDNVGSKQMQQIRIALRGTAEVLMGKNTMIRKAIRGHIDNNPDLERLLPLVKGNVGFVFTKGDLLEIRNAILENKVAAPAKAGALAPCDVFIPKGNTGMGPEKTSFFQALNISTKITRGTIEILSDVHLVKLDTRVGASESALLNMLSISPFSYGLIINAVYDSGSVFSPDVLDITDEDLMKHFIQGVTNIASVSLQIGFPTVASAPHSLANGFRNLAAVAAETDVTFKEVEQLKAFLADPSAFASLIPAAATADAGGETKAEEKAEEKAESESESDDDMGFGLFD